MPPVEKRWNTRSTWGSRRPSGEAGDPITKSKKNKTKKGGEKTMGRMEDPEEKPSTNLVRNRSRNSDEWKDPVGNREPVGWGRAWNGGRMAGWWIGTRSEDLVKAT